MTEEDKKLLAVFEVRARDMLALCDKQERQIETLNGLLATTNEELQQAKDMINRLRAKCDGMLTARIVSREEGDMRSARMRLSKLVREVDKCLTLLND